MSYPMFVSSTGYERGDASFSSYPHIIMSYPMLFTTGYDWEESTKFSKLYPPWLQYPPITIWYERRGALPINFCSSIKELWLEDTGYWGKMFTIGHITCRTMVSLSDYSDIYFISSTHSGYFTTDPDRSDCFSASARSAYPFSGTWAENVTLLPSHFVVADWQMRPSWGCRLSTIEGTWRGLELSPSYNITISKNIRVYICFVTWLVSLYIT